MTKPKRLGIFFFALTAAAAAWYFTTQDNGPAPPLAEITSIAQLKQEFNASPDSIRIIVLLSPT